MNHYKLASALFAGLLAFGLSAHAADTKAVDPVADQVSKIPCSTCHADLVKDYVKGHHGNLHNTKAPGNDCASCHGETLRHMSNPVKEKPQFTFKLDKQGFMDEKSRAESDKVCTSCHKDAEKKHWAGSAHQRAGLACVSCHNNHKPDISINKKTSTAQCLSCHQEMKADLFKTSTHPLLDGQMNCVSCHNPHGTKAGGEALMKKQTVNETCFTCHPGKRGPFVYPHQPVTENCANCHNPHGSNKAPMLKARGDQLCMSCHRNAHMREPARKVGCTSCHTAIHGSNAPTQGDKLIH